MKAFEALLDESTSLGPTGLIQKSVLNESPEITSYLNGILCKL